jgi:GTP1/Obg family GTP-binding protein
MVKFTRTADSEDIGYIIIEYGVANPVHQYLVLDRISEIAGRVAKRDFANLSFEEIREKIREVHNKLKEDFEENAEISISENRFRFKVEKNKNTKKNIRRVHRRFCKLMQKAMDELRKENENRGLDEWIIRKMELEL